MWWSQADADTYKTWLSEAGLRVTGLAFVPEGSGGHALFWARRAPAGQARSACRASPPANRDRGPLHGHGQEQEQEQG